MSVDGILSLKNGRPKKRTIEATINKKTRECEELDQYMGRLESRSKAMNDEIDSSLREHIRVQQSFQSIDEKLRSINAKRPSAKGVAENRSEASVGLTANDHFLPASIKEGTTSNAPQHPGSLSPAPVTSFAPLVKRATDEAIERLFSPSENAQPKTVFEKQDFGVSKPPQPPVHERRKSNSAQPGSPKRKEETIDRIVMDILLETESGKRGLK